MKKFSKNKIALFLACASIFGEKTQAMNKNKPQNPQSLVEVGGEQNLYAAPSFKNKILNWWNSLSKAKKYGILGAAGSIIAGAIAVPVICAAVKNKKDNQRNNEKAPNDEKQKALIQQQEDVIDKQIRIEEEQEKLAKQIKEKEEIKRQQEEEAKRLEEEKKKLVEEERKAKEKQDQEAQEKLKKKQEEIARQQKELKEKQEKEKEERRRLEEENRRKAEEQRRLEEEKRRIAEEQRKLEEEKRRIAEEERKKKEEERRRLKEEEERRIAEEERKKKEEELKAQQAKIEEERKAKEKEQERKQWIESFKIEKQTSFDGLLEELNSKFDEYRKKFNKKLFSFNANVILNGICDILQRKGEHKHSEYDRHYRYFEEFEKGVNNCLLNNNQNSISCEMKYSDTRWLWIEIDNANCQVCVQESVEGVRVKVYLPGIFSSGNGFCSENLKLAEEYKYNDKWYDAESYKALKGKLFPSGKIE